MEKINFVNGQEPALNGTNLNLLQDNIEEAIDSKVDKANTITFNNEWVFCHKVAGGGIIMQLPLNNPSKKSINVNITSAQVHLGGWHDVPFNGVSPIYETCVYLKFDTPTTVTLTEGYSYLMRLKGTVSIAD